MSLLLMDQLPFGSEQLPFYRAIKDSTPDIDVSSAFIQYKHPICSDFLGPFLLGCFISTRHDKLTSLFSLLSLPCDSICQTNNSSLCLSA